MSTGILDIPNNTVPTMSSFKVVHLASRFWIKHQGCQSPAFHTNEKHWTSKNGKSTYLRQWQPSKTCVEIYPPQTKNIAHENSHFPKRKSSSHHWFSGAMLVSGRVWNNCTTEKVQSQCSQKLPWRIINIIPRGTNFEPHWTAYCLSPRVWFPHAAPIYDIPCSFSIFCIHSCHRLLKLKNSVSSWCVLFSTGGIFAAAKLLTGAPAKHNLGSLVLALRFVVAMLLVIIFDASKAMTVPMKRI